MCRGMHADHLLLPIERSLIKFVPCAPAVGLYIGRGDGLTMRQMREPVEVYQLSSVTTIVEVYVELFDCKKTQTYWYYAGLVLRCQGSRIRGIGFLGC